MFSEKLGYWFFEGIYVGWIVWKNYLFIYCVLIQILIFVLMSVSNDYLPSAENTFNESYK